MARPRWSTGCCSNPACTAPTSAWSSAPWIPTTWSASAVSRSWPRPPRSNGRAPASISSTRRATPISAARSSASSTWWTALWCWSTPPRARCRKPNSWCRRRCAWASSPSSSSTKSTARTRVRSRSSTKCSTCLPHSTPPTTSSISRFSTAPPNKAGWRPRWKARTTTACSRCSIWCSATSSRRWWSKGRSACSAPSWKPIPISAASSPAASPPVRSSRTSRSRCSITTAS